MNFSYLKNFNFTVHKGLFLPVPFLLHKYCAMSHKILSTLASMNNTKNQNASLKGKCQYVLLEGLSALQVKATGKILPKHCIHLKRYFVTITGISKSIQ